LIQQVRSTSNVFDEGMNLSEAGSMPDFQPDAFMAWRYLFEHAANTRQHPAGRGIKLANVILAHSGG
jgi:hypothetical protein